MRTLLATIMMLLGAAALPALAQTPAQPGTPAPAPGETATAPAVSLGERYIDPLNGFSLRPPRDAERYREPSARRLVGWAMRDEKTAAIRWSLDVIRARHKPNALPAEDYCKLIAKELATSVGMKVDSAKVVTVAGKSAMDFSGVGTGENKNWLRQVWVELSPTDHLVLEISGPADLVGELNGVMSAVTGSMAVFDPSENVKLQREAFQRGSSLLESLKEDSLREAISAEPLFFVFQYKGKNAGFVKITEAMKSAGFIRTDASGKKVTDKYPGLSVVQVGSMKLGDAPRILSRQDLFATPDREMELWKRTVADGQDKSATRAQEAVKQHSVIEVKSLEAGKAAKTPLHREIPAAIVGGYLPGAFDSLLVRLIVRTPPAGATTRPSDRTYAFATYNVNVNGFDLRTVAIGDAEEITLGGKKVKAIKITDQLAADAAPATVWVDEKGMILRLQSAEGLTMEQADAKTITDQYAGDLAELEKMAPTERVAP